MSSSVALALAGRDCQFPKLYNIFKNLGGLHEIPSASRPRCGQAYRRRIEDSWRHYHSGQCQGKALAGRNHRRRPGWPLRSRQADPDRSQGRRPVLFGKWSGTEVKLDGVELLIMKESDIIGV